MFKSTSKKSLPGKLKLIKHFSLPAASTLFAVNTQQLEWKQQTLSEATKYLIFYSSETVKNFLTRKYYKNLTFLFKCIPQNSYFKEIHSLH